MAQHSLYRRYRPRRFAEVRGQDHVVSALRNAVATSTEVHAYLFSGPRGTGKTSTARILAKALNCENLTDGEPCCECDSCVAMEKGGSFDLFELDAASNNGVDAIRDLVDRAAVSSPGRTKVYILDEVHMLTTAASNALLKTLEEPPDHVCFVLATTDPQKVLPTIQSRTQHFRFQLLTAAELDSYVRWIATDAGLEVADSEVEHVVREGRGSARDTLTALDQVVAAGGVAVVEQPVEALFEAMQQASAGVAVAAVASAIEQGSDPRVLGEAFLGALRDAFLVSMGVSTQHMLEVEAAQATDRAGSLGPKRLTAAMESIGEALVEMRQAADPRIPLEVALVRLSASAGSASEAASVPEAGSAAPAGSASAAPAESATTGAAEASHGAEIAELQRQIGVLTRKVEALEARGNGASQKSPAPPTPPPRKRRREPTGATAASQSSAKPQRPTETPRPTPAPEPAQRAEPSTSDSPSAGGTPEASPEQSPPEPPAQSPTPSPAEPSPAASSTQPTTVDRDAVVMAFGDQVVGRLRGIAKAIFSNGRFVSAGPGGAVVALENEHTVKQAGKYVAEVEKLLAEALAQPMPITLVTEANAGSAASGSSETPTASTPATNTPAAGTPGTPAGPPPNAPPAGEGREDRGNTLPREVAPRSQETDGLSDEIEDVGDVHSLKDADVATSAVDKIIQAFPGSEVIDPGDYKKDSP